MTPAIYHLLPSPFLQKFGVANPPTAMFPSIMATNLTTIYLFFLSMANHFSTQTLVQTFHPVTTFTIGTQNVTRLNSTVLPKSPMHWNPIYVRKLYLLFKTIGIVSTLKELSARSEDSNFASTQAPPHQYGVTPSLRNSRISHHAEVYQRLAQQQLDPSLRRRLVFKNRVSPKAPPRARHRH